MLLLKQKLSSPTAEDSGNLIQHLHPDAFIFRQQRGKLCLKQCNRHRALDGHNRCSARSLIKESQLTHQFTGSKLQICSLQQLVAGIHPNLSTDDDKDSVALIALLKDNLILLVNSLMQEFIHLKNLLVGKLAKYRDVFQHLDSLFVHISAEKSHSIKIVHQKMCHTTTPR